MKNLNIRTILILVVLISTLSVMYQEVFTQLVLIFLVILMIFAKNISQEAKKKTIKRLKNIGRIILTVMVFQIVFRQEGIPIISVGGFGITDVGIKYGFSSSLRFLVIILIATLLFDYPYKDYLIALRAWKFPYEISFLIASVIHFIPIFSQEFNNTLEALHLRGIELKKLSIINRFRAFITLIFPTIARALNDIQYRAIALDLRAFRLKKCRTSLHDDKLAYYDIIIQIAAFIIFAGVIYIKKI